MSGDDNLRSDSDNGSDLTDDADSSDSSSLGDLARDIKERRAQADQSSNSSWDKLLGQRTSSGQEDEDESARSSQERTDGPTRTSDRNHIHPDRDILASLGDASNVLLLGPLQHSEVDGACMELLSVEQPQETDLLFVTVTQSPDDRIRRWQSLVGDLPRNLAVVSVGEGTRSAATTPGIEGDTSLLLEGVSDPSNLSRLGMMISKFASDWEATGNQTVMCFHSITALLQYVDTQSLFQFLHILQGRMNSVGAVAHYHADPAVHDQLTMSTLRPLFDAVVEWTDRGEFEITGETR